MSDSSFHAKTFCDYYNQDICRSCSWLELPYAEQITRKENRLRGALSFLPDFTLLSTTPSAPFGFRNKAKMSITGTIENPIVGILGPQNLDQGRELLACPIHHPQINQVIAALPTWIKMGNLIPYQIASRSGELKGVILFYSEKSDEMYLRFILRSKECVSRIRKLLPKMQEKFPELVCVSANLQPIPHAVLEGREEFILSSRDSIRHPIENLTLTLSPQAFVQTNTQVATRLYQTAAEWLSNLKPKTMLELFCGQGAFSFFAAPHVEKSIGIEINPEAVQTANETAKILVLPHLQFLCADVNVAPEAENSILSLAHKINPDCLLVNPPRRGLGTAGIEFILSQKPAHLIYSSCSVESLAEDLRKLSSLYTFQKCQIFELFPHTPHFEILVLLRRQ